MRDETTGTKGAVACGHPATAAAAREMLQDGGTAFDAALAALCAAAVAEPVLCSLAGGGFLLAWPKDQPPCLYDFFVQTPSRRPYDRSAVEDLDFRPILADFGTATQEFHIGLGSMATPGVVKGLFAVHRDLARLPIGRIVEPAIRLAREGVPLRRVDTYLFSIVGSILTASPEAAATYARADGTLLREGDRLVQPSLAQTLEALANDGEELFYRGDIAQMLVAACRVKGGLLTSEDLAEYQVAKRQPLDRRYRSARIAMNPPPSTGGILIALALALLGETDMDGMAHGTAEHIALLTRVMALTNRARVETQLDRAAGEAEELAAAERILDPELLERYAHDIRGRRKSFRGTTHISVADGDGNLASLTLSNGEGCGYVLPGTGIMLNNMLGEEDLNPGGFHRWQRSSRLASMMTPSIARLDDDRIVALGSGGSNRIRTAILQVLVGLIDLDQSLEEAVLAPRLHFEDGVENVEAGFPDKSVVAALGADDLWDQVGRRIDWPEHNLFFGGVHAVLRDKTGRLTAAGDPRRGGAAVVL